MYKISESFINIWRWAVHTINSLTPATEVQRTETILQNKALRAIYGAACSELPQNPTLTHTGQTI